MLEAVLVSAVGGFVAIGVLSVAAAITGSVLVIPPLGASAFVVFHTPTQPVASPRNVLLGQLCGAVVGYACLVAFGLSHHPAALAEGMTDRRVLAAAVAVGVTSGLMVLGRVQHGPACATTLVFALGILRLPSQLATVLLGFV